MVLSKLRKALQRRGSNQQEQKQQAKKKMPRRASTGSIDDNTWYDIPQEIHVAVKLPWHQIYDDSSSSLLD